MYWGTALQLAIRALWRNKTRAMLTALGVIIGVASVIAMVAVGTGAQARIAAQLESMGSSSLTVRAGSVTRGGVRTGVGTVSTLVYEDALALADLPGVVAVSPNVRTSQQVRYGGANWGTSIEGVTPDWLSVRSWTLEEGEFLSERHVVAADHVCVLGRTVARELFGVVSPVGHTILVKGLACRVLGVLAPKGASAWGTDQDDSIVMPLTTVQRKLLGITYIHGIEIETTGAPAASRLEDEVARVLRQRHRLQPGQEDDFRIYNRAELAAATSESARVFTWLLGSIASVSLLVGGIGIMNIMLVSVTERTREIGIRMALGARRRDILWQFLLESLVLSGAGGVIGVLLGVGGGLLLGEVSQFSIRITPWSVALAFAFAVLVGVFFGMHPARKAARLRPIEALRYE
ncbi:MAG TPA: FtsX-like permease family protein [Thioalkalivibrio sp.]|nr:FtsX-like permease family protein [Thioalkalivibrio sp.]